MMVLRVECEYRNSNSVIDPLMTVSHRHFAIASFLTLISLGCFAFPMYVIRPFRHQDPQELAVALAVKQFGPWLSLLCVAGCAVFAGFIWKQSNRRWLRAGAVCTVFISGLGAYLARVNVYELMFHPIDVPAFETANSARIDADDMVISVRLKREARAYPIREMGYHHIVNDVVGAVPIVATY
jgi:hypothetical protein